MGVKTKPDFGGYATKAGIKCTDGRTITPDAFKHQDTLRVPLVWQHSHDDSENVLGHAILENREDGVYAYGYFNATTKGQNAKELVKHGDITALSIYANQLVEKSKSVLHGMIREVSLVLSGANAGAVIDHVQIQHSDSGAIEELPDEAIITMGTELHHSANPEKEETDETDVEHSDTDSTVQDVYDSMTPVQQDVVHYMVGAALAGDATDGDTTDTTDAQHSDNSEDDDAEIKHGEDTKDMKIEKKNVFEGGDADTKEKGGHVLTHSDIKGIVEHAVKGEGSLRKSVEEFALSHGIDNIELLFPDYKSTDNTPQFDSRRVEWVSGVLSGVKKSPFSRVKTLIADITFDDARAKGYIKGSLKKEEFFPLSKRTTGPATIYKKQKLDRDDVIDITDFDVVAWMRQEMRLMLDEEIARAILIGDGRAVDDDDKIKDPIGATEGTGIRSILNDDDLFAAHINVNVLDANSDYSEVIDAVTRGMKYYKGSGSPTFYTTLPILTEMLLLKDDMNRRLYRTPADVASELGVANIVTVEVMESQTDCVGIIVNLSDYTLGADKGGEVTMFDDFDIDYNQLKYLIETRCSGGLTKIRSAVVVHAQAASDALVVPVKPAFVKSSGLLTPATTTHVTYKRADTNATVTNGSPLTLDPGESLKIYSVPAAGYYFADDQTDEWTFKRDAS